MSHLKPCQSLYLSWAGSSYSESLWLIHTQKQPYFFFCQHTHTWPQLKPEIRALKLILGKWTIKAFSTGPGKMWKTPSEMSDKWISVENTLEFEGFWDFLLQYSHSFITTVPSFYSSLYLKLLKYSNFIKHLQINESHKISLLKQKVLILITVMGKMLQVNKIQIILTIYHSPSLLQSSTLY